MRPPLYFATTACPETAYPPPISAWTRLGDAAQPAPRQLNRRDPAAAFSRDELRQIVLDLMG